MGMDVYGKNPDDPSGDYFRASVWSWHPLWDFCMDVAPDIIPSDNLGHSNDGWGLGKLASKRLARRLRESQPLAQVMRDALEAKLLMTPRPVCPHCNGTGTRTDEVGIKLGYHERYNLWTRRPGWCNGCDGRGTREPVEAHYRLDPQLVMEFSVFLDHCGGFSIH